MIKKIIYGNKSYSKIFLGGGLYWSSQSKPTLEEYILTGNGEEALSYAVTSILGSDIIWSLDAPNKRITYKTK